MSGRGPNLVVLGDAVGADAEQQRPDRAGPLPLTTIIDYGILIARSLEAIRMSRQCGLDVSLEKATGEKAKSRRNEVDYGATRLGYGRHDRAGHARSCLKVAGSRRIRYVRRSSSRRRTKCQGRRSCRTSGESRRRATWPSRFVSPVRNLLVSRKIARSESETS